MAKATTWTNIDAEVRKRSVLTKSCKSMGFGPWRKTEDTSLTCPMLEHNREKLRIILDGCGRLEWPSTESFGGIGLDCDRLGCKWCNGPLSR